jgi:hypothetical protein
MVRFTTGLIIGAVIAVLGGAALGVHAFSEDDELISNAVWMRVECIEQKESRGRNIANLQGSGAVGVMQYMPRTFYAHALEMGHEDWSAWEPDQARSVAAHDLMLGRRRQWTVSGC